MLLIGDHPSARCLRISYSDYWRMPLYLRNHFVEIMSEWRREEQVEYEKAKAGGKSGFRR